METINDDMKECQHKVNRWKWIALVFLIGQWVFIPILFIFIILDNLNAFWVTFTIWAITAAGWVTSKWYWDKNLESQLNLIGITLKELKELEN